MRDIDSGKRAYKVDFACQAPVTSEYYIVVGGDGANFTLDVTTAAPTCLNNCSRNGVCKNNGVCACYFVCSLYSPT